jgi:ABC-type bacteriocin/lantibiotic exporter with double-glycine peptidase domain
VAQVKDGCGAAVISMVMRYWEIRPGQTASGLAEPERIEAALASRAEGGIAASDMERYFRASGYHTFAFRANWSDLQHHLQAGRPLIVSLKASGPLGPLHYVVVVGIDAERGFLFLNDPAKQKLLRISREGFESEWNATNDWALLVLPQPAN